MIKYFHEFLVQLEDFNPTIKSPLNLFCITFSKCITKGLTAMMNNFLES